MATASGKILDSRQKLRVMEDAMIDRQVETPIVGRKQAVQPRVGKHYPSKTKCKTKFHAKTLSRKENSPCFSSLRLSDLA